MLLLQNFESADVPYRAPAPMKTQVWRKIQCMQNIQLLFKGSRFFPCSEASVKHPRAWSCFTVGRLSNLAGTCSTTEPVCWDPCLKILDYTKGISSPAISFQQSVNPLPGFQVEVREGPQLSNKAHVLHAKDPQVRPPHQSEDTCCLRSWSDLPVMFW